MRKSNKTTSYLYRKYDDSDQLNISNETKDWADFWLAILCFALDDPELCGKVLTGLGLGGAGEGEGDGLGAGLGVGIGLIGIGLTEGFIAGKNKNNDLLLCPFGAFTKKLNPSTIGTPCGVRQVSFDSPKSVPLTGVPIW